LTEQFGYSMSVTQEIKSRLDIVDLVSESVTLRRSGRNYAGFCPFHANSRTPAFYVFPETQTWRCFGACAEGGDIFSFVTKKEGWEFKEALTFLAQRAGVTLEERRPVDAAQSVVEDRLGDLLAASADYFHQLLLHAPQAEPARRYVDGRGLNAQTIETFRLGFALDSWDACRTHFNAQGYSDDDLLDAGLLTENPDKGTRYDRFRNRLMIPIRDVNGRTVGFGARTLEPDGIPKYLNSPQTTLFDKSSLLYGLDTARRHIREARQVVIVEGYLDVMQAWQAGFGNVVAQMGTALTERQLQLLKRYTKRFVLALDADAAGAKATLRGLEVARETLDHETEVRFAARGLVQHEERLQAEIRVVTLPPGHDPDKIIRTDPTRWPQLLTQARPVVAYVIEVATQGLDQGDAKGKAAVARQVIPLIKDIADPVERDHYWQQLARALQVDERALRQLRPTTKTAKPGGPAEKVQTGATTAVFNRANATQMREMNFLRQCLRYPGVLARVNQKLQQQEQPILSAADFTTPEDRLLLPHLYRWSDAGTVATVAELCDSLDDAVLQERVKSLLAEQASPKSEPDRLPDTLVLSVYDWRLAKIRQLVSDVQQLFHEAQRQDDADSLEIYKQLQALSLAVLKINRARDAMSAVNRRRAEALNGRNGHS
jgi:DNA primase